MYGSLRDLKINKQASKQKTNKINKSSADLYCRLGDHQMNNQTNKTNNPQELLL